MATREQIIWVNRQREFEHRLSRRLWVWRLVAAAMVVGIAGVSALLGS